MFDDLETHTSNKNKKLRAGSETIKIICVLTAITIITWLPFTINFIIK